MGTPPALLGAHKDFTYTDVWVPSFARPRVKEGRTNARLQESDSYSLGL